MKLPPHFPSPPEPIWVRKDLWTAQRSRCAFPGAGAEGNSRGLRRGDAPAGKRGEDVAHSKARLRRTKLFAPDRRGAAFSLLELLVVIAIIGILSSLAVLSFGSIGRASGGRGAADLASSTALAARVEAMAHGYGAYFVIDNSSDVNRRWQRIGVLRFTNSGPNDYEVVGKLTALPAGTFFLPQYSSSDLVETNLTGLGGSGTTPVLALRFGGTGHLVEPNPARLVFSANIMNASGNLENPESMLAARQGFLLRRNGRPTFFRDAAQMPPNP